LRAMRREAWDWLEQARADLRAATVSLEQGVFFAASFWCHQVAEKALKALHVHLARSLPPRTHSLIELMTLIREVEGEVESLRDYLAELELQYLPTRYVNAAGTIPQRAYSESMSRRHVNQATAVLRWVEERMGRAG